MNYNVHKYTIHSRGNIVCGGSMYMSTWSNEWENVTCYECIRGKKNMNPTFSYNMWYIPNSQCFKRHTTDFANERQFVQALTEWNRIAKLNTPVAWRYEVA